MLETSHSFALAHRPMTSHAAAVRPPNLQKTMGAMARVTPHHYGYDYGYYYLGFPYAPEKILLIAERI
jgi:hypothetical protein